MTPPEGFRYRDDALTEAEEQAFVREIESLPFKPFEFHGYLGKRRIVSFGWRYDYGARAVRRSDPLPPFLLPLRRRAADLTGIDARQLEHALVTEYAPGAPIGWHRDKPEFGEVVAFSFVSPCRLRLRRRKGSGWERWAIDVQPRSLYRLSGPVRHDWEHSIPPVAALRYSVTFRTFLGARRAASSIHTGA
ncbi:MAG TPA: alpha-ketoglutarate-dependent dioxygenase AlkB [Reyranella sp.]|jgi:alkylated DNA repair dioxygenase AlkB|nr:alpha-ketoglutarate-dependent dioxygenase AlkB [Reyranella sp.]